MYPEQNIEGTSLQEAQTKLEHDLSLRPVKLSHGGRITEVQTIFKETMKDLVKMFEMFRIDIKTTPEEDSHHKNYRN